MATYEAVNRKIHRIAAGLLLLTMIPAGYVSFKGADPANPSPLVYLPLLPLFVLIITGTYQLVMPWIRKRRARRGVGASG